MGRGTKCKREEPDVELQKLGVLKQMAAVCTGQDHHYTAFWKQVSMELRLMDNPKTLCRLKRDIMCLIYDSHASSLTVAPLHTNTSTPHMSAHHPYSTQCGGSFLESLNSDY